MPKYKPCEDHIGNKFSSVQAMCEYWNIDRGTYEYRKKQGWPTKKALTLPSKSTFCEDHLGNKFPSIKNMCEHWNINNKMYECRIQQGWSTEKALTKSKMTVGHQKQCEDHLGNKFHSIKDMCKHWNMNDNRYKGRIRHGWSVKKALTTWSTKTYISDNCKILKQIDDDYYECLFNNKHIIMTCEQIRSIKT